MVDEKLSVVVCPGMHEPRLTVDFLQSMQETIAGIDLEWLVFPAERYPAYSGLHVLRFLHERRCAHDPETALKVPIALIGFSAGVIGAIAAAHGWQALGGRVQTLIALDGWGVPLGGNFPIHRLSHDYFTHWSSAWLGAGTASFYAEPGVEHLELWRSPNAIGGLQIAANHATSTTAARFIAHCLQGCDE